jgi:CheY-like chemotaxis protein
MNQALMELQSELSMKESILKEYEEAPFVEASRARLVQAVVNVIRNALEAIPSENAERYRIWLRTKTSEEGYALLEVEDNGVGLGEDLVGRVFEPFFTTKAGATGVGLAVSQGILSAIGGTIAFHRRSPGTLVQIRLPPYRRRSERGPDQAARVLIIDDEEKVCTALRRILGGRYQTSIQIDPREALAAFRKGERYDLVFCDLRMPYISGQDLYRELEKIAPEQVERIVFMTADPERATHSQFLCSVSNFYVEKPFDTQRVRELAIEAMK